MSRSELADLISKLRENDITQLETMRRKDALYLAEANQRARDWQRSAVDAQSEAARLRGEVERLREVVRQVHALVSTVRATAVLDDIEKLRGIHEITKEQA